MSKNTSISLGDYFTNFIEGQLSQGRYGSASEVVRAGLRLLEEHDAHVATVQAALIEDEESGFPEEFDFDEFLAGKRAGLENSASMRSKRSIAAKDFAHYPDEWRLSPVVESEHFLFLSGQTGCRPDGTIAEDPETQFRETFDFIKSNLAAAGADFDDVVDMTSYHVDLRDHLDAFTRVKDEFVAAPYPAWTAIGVKEMITIGALVEVHIVAHRRQI